MIRALLATIVIFSSTTLFAGQTSGTNMIDLPLINQLSVPNVSSLKVGMPKLPPRPQMPRVPRIKLGRR